MSSGWKQKTHIRPKRRQIAIFGTTRPPWQIDSRSGRWCFLYFWPQSTHANNGLLRSGDYLSVSVDWQVAHASGVHLNVGLACWSYPRWPREKWSRSERKEKKFCIYSLRGERRLWFTLPTERPTLAQCNTPAEHWWFERLQEEAVEGRKRKNMIKLNPRSRICRWYVVDVYGSQNILDEARVRWDGREFAEREKDLLEKTKSSSLCSTPSGLENGSKNVISKSQDWTELKIIQVTKKVVESEDENDDRGRSLRSKKARLTPPTVLRLEAVWVVLWFTQRLMLCTKRWYYY